MQHDHRPRALRKLLQCVLEPLSQLASFRRITEGRRNGFGKFLRVSYLAPTGEIECRVGDDSIEPCSKRLRSIEPIQGLMRPQKSFLHGVFGILVGQNDRPRHYVGTALVQAHEAGEPPIVPLLGKTYELSLLVRNTCGCAQLLTG